MRRGREPGRELLLRALWWRPGTSAVLLLTGALTVVVATHDPEVAARCHSVVELVDGHVA